MQRVSYLENVALLLYLRSKQWKVEAANVPLSVSEQILHNIKQEYKRLQKRRHLDSAFQHVDSCSPLDLPNIHSGSAVPGNCWLQPLKRGAADLALGFSFFVVSLQVQSTYLYSQHWLERTKRPWKAQFSFCFFPFCQSDRPVPQGHWGVTVTIINSNYIRNLLT